MKKRICGLILAVVFAVGLGWDSERGQKMDVTSHLKLKTELHLTDLQTERVKAVFEDIHQRKMALKTQNADQKSPEVQGQYKKLMDEQDTRLKEILTAEQLTKYEQLKNQHAAKNQTEHKKLV